MIGINWFLKCMLGIHCCFSECMIVRTDFVYKRLPPVYRPPRGPEAGSTLFKVMTSHANLCNNWLCSVYESVNGFSVQLPPVYRPS